VTWTLTPERVAELPLVLAGPILRRVDQSTGCASPAPRDPNPCRSSSTALRREISIGWPAQV